MYSKEEIDSLFREYVKTEDDGVFWKVVEACDPMIEARLANYRESCPLEVLEDIKQEVKIKMYQNLRNSVRREGAKTMYAYLKSPSTYLYFKVWQFVAVEIGKYKKVSMRGLQVNFSEYGKKLLSKILSVFLDPEKQYIVRKDLPRILLEWLKQKLADHKSQKYHPEAQRATIREWKKEIEETFGTNLDEEEK